MGKTSRKQCESRIQEEGDFTFQNSQDKKKISISIRVCFTESFLGYAYFSIGALIFCIS